MRKDFAEKALNITATRMAIGDRIIELGRNGLFSVRKKTQGHILVHEI